MPQLQEADWESAIRRGLEKIAINEKEWAGLPMAHDYLRLIVEPRYPFPGLNGFRYRSDDDEDEFDREAFERLKRTMWKGQNEDRKIELINMWISGGYKILVWRWQDDSRVRCTKMPVRREQLSMSLQLNTMGASEVWSMEAELNAMVTLKGLVRKHNYHQYVMTGTFVELSKRSGLFYVFRRCRPTLVASPRFGQHVKPIAALCLHPIGFYERSFAGCMVPTDDVIAHLLMMRGDERLFWAKANHHPLDEPTSGL